MIKKIFLYFGLLGCIILSLGYFSLATESGLICWVKLGSFFLPGQLTLQNLEGSLISGIRFQDLDYRDPQNTIHIQTFSSHWSVKTMLTQPLLLVETLEMKNVSIASHSKVASTDKQTFNFLPYLKYLRFKNIQLTHLQVFINKAFSFKLNKMFIRPNSTSDYLFQLEATANQQPIRGLGQFYFKEAYPIFKKLELHYGKAHFSLQGELAKQLNMQVTLLIPQLQDLLPQARGSLSLQGKIKGSMDQPQFDAQLLVHQLKLPTITQEIVLPQIKIELNTQFNNQHSLLHLTATFDTKNHVFAHFNLAPFNKISNFSEPIQGEGKLALLDLSVLNRWLRAHPLGLRITQGELIGPFQVRGNLNKPLLRYQFVLNHGILSLPEFGHQLKDLNFTIQQNPGEEIQLQGHFNLGEGRGELNGSLNPETTFPSAQLHLKGQNLKVYDTPEYRITASPDLQLNLENKNLLIKGNLVIPNAHIHLSDLNSGRSLSTDVVFVDEQKTSTVGLYDNLALAIKLIIENKVDIQYQNLNAQLKGNIFITNKPGNPPLVTGELYTLKGYYRAYGRQLDIQKGRLIYTGNLLSNPGLDIRATQKIKSIIYGDPTQMNSSMMTSSQSVGIQVRGTFDKPMISLFSDPPGLSQGDILSFLILGRPQSEAAEGASLALLSAASGLADGSDSDSFQNKLGLNELGIGTTQYYNPATGLSQNSTTANIGKNLGSKVSLHYSVGIFDPVSIISLRYQINKYFILQSETSSLENAGDLLYQIESAE